RHGAARAVDRVDLLAHVGIVDGRRRSGRHAELGAIRAVADLEDRTGHVERPDLAGGAIHLVDADLAPLLFVDLVVEAGLLSGGTRRVVGFFLGERDPLAVGGGAERLDRVAWRRDGRRRAARGRNAPHAHVLIVAALAQEQDRLRVARPLDA